MPTATPLARPRAQLEPTRAQLEPTRARLDPTGAQLESIGARLACIGARLASRVAPLAAAAGVLATLLTAGCQLAPPRTVELVPRAASDALHRARVELRSERAGAGERARDALLLAAQVAPEWVAPRRLLDDLERRALRGHLTLERHLRALETDPDDAAALYLAGRLEGPQRARERFERAIRAAPDMAWGYHGLAWVQLVDGELRAAVRNERRALLRAADPFEESYFTATLARLYAAAGSEEEALDLCRERLGEPDVQPVDRLALGVQTACYELAHLFGRRSLRGERRAFELLTQPGLTASEARQLSDALLEVAQSGERERRADEIVLALRDGNDGRHDLLLAELLLLRGEDELALGVLRRALGPTEPADRGPSSLALDPGLRSARIRTGELPAVFEEWLALQPSVVVGRDGLPRDPRLRDVVAAAREAGRALAQGTDAARRLTALGDALLAAGWYEEAGAVAARLAPFSIDAALRLDRRARAGRGLMASLVELMRSVDTGEAPRPTVARPEPRRPVRDLGELLDEMEVLFVERERQVAGERRRGERPHAFAASPRLSYGPLAEVVHPGPLFSPADELAGLGRTGTRVGGVAQAFARVGRFAVFGQSVLTGKPDGTILRRAHVEVRRGEHLGQPWSGTVAWCDGADLASRPGRRGARIGGAALHEGYWIDFATLREEVETWRWLERRYFDEDGVRRMAACFAPGGPRRDQALAGGRAAAAELPPLLGEGDRVRLAVLRDRAERRERTGTGRSGEPLFTLDDVALVTAIHEQGHLCDRARFLPFSQRFWSALRFFAESGFSPQRAERRLEYRAQLVALCESPDPRVALAEVLTAAEVGSRGITPHSVAYTRLLTDFLARLEAWRASDPARWPLLDGERLLAHQLHRLTAEEVRGVALSLARDERLTTEGWPSDLRTASRPSELRAFGGTSPR